MLAIIFVKKSFEIIELDVHLPISHQSPFLQLFHHMKIYFLNNDILGFYVRFNEYRKIALFFFFTNYRLIVFILLLLVYEIWILLLLLLSTQYDILQR